MDKPVISVIVPIYNVEKYLERCISSLVSQTYTNLEIILVDDGSPDKCNLICDNWAKKDKRIKVIHKINGGSSSARNEGLKNATGEYLAFVDSDDYIEKDMYSQMITTLLKTNSQLACCGQYVVYETHKKIAHCLNNSELVIDKKTALKEMLSNGFISEAPWDKLYKKSLFDNIEFPIGEINEDIVILPTIFDRCESIVHIGKPLYYYCQNGSSITRSKYNDKKQIILEHMKYISQYVLEKYPDLSNAVSLFNARYSLSLLFLLYDNKEIKKKYHFDYKNSKLIFKKNFMSLLNSKNIDISTKLKGILIYTNTYSFFRTLKRIIK